MNTKDFVLQGKKSFFDDEIFFFLDMNTVGHKDRLYQTTGETATSTFFVAFFSFLWVERETRAFWICLSSLFCVLLLPNNSL